MLAGNGAGECSKESSTGWTAKKMTPASGSGGDEPWHGPANGASRIQAPMDSHSICASASQAANRQSRRARSHLLMRPATACAATGPLRWRSGHQTSLLGLQPAAFPMPCYSYRMANMCAMPFEPAVNPGLAAALQVEELYRLPSLADMVAASE